MSRYGAIAADATQRVNRWPSLVRRELAPGEWVKCESGGFLVQLDEGAFPVWRWDMESVRRLLLARDLVAAELTKS